MGMMPCPFSFDRVNLATGFTSRDNPHHSCRLSMCPMAYGCDSSAEVHDRFRYSFDYDSCRHGHAASLVSVEFDPASIEIKGERQFHGVINEINRVPSTELRGTPREIGLRPSKLISGRVTRKLACFGSIKLCGHFTRSDLIFIPRSFPLWRRKFVIATTV